MSLTKFPNWNHKVGDRISAREWNDTQRAIARLDAALFGSNLGGVSNGAGHYRRADSPLRMELVQFHEAIGPDESSEFRDRQAKIVYWDYRTYKWKVAEDEQIETATDAFKHAVFADGERHLVFYHAQSGKFLPAAAQQVRIVMTVPPAEGEYPARDETPNTYPIVHVRLTYRAEPGKRDVNVTVLESIERLDPDRPHGGKVDGDITLGTVMNLACQEDEDTYLPPYSLVPGYFINGQWFTYACCPSCPGSESSVSVSQSSISISESSLSGSFSGSLSGDDGSGSDQTECEGDINDPSSIPIGDDAAYIIGIGEDGCPVRIPVCPPGGGGGGEESGFDIDSGL